MRSNKSWILIFGTSVFIFAALVFVFIFSTKGKPRPDIPLPDPAITNPTDLLPPSLLNDPAEYLPIELTPDNVQDVLRMLRRPARYIHEYTTAVSAQTDKIISTVHLRQNGTQQFYTISEQTRGSAAQPQASSNYLLTENNMYIWRTGEAAYETYRLGNIPAFASMRLPDISFLLSLDPADIQTVSFEPYDIYDDLEITETIWTIQIIYKIDETMTEQLLVMIDNGLVVACATYFTLHGAYQAVIESHTLSITYPEKDIPPFTLPDGKLPD